ncbi:MAG: hypothetical protein HWE16_12565 [Gammaproteobacteria bacterium]|nr:hypothetical protein [Gammaproteobacteria bacterium]
MSLSFAEKWLKTLAALHIIGGLLLPVLALTSLSNHYIQSLEGQFPNSNPDVLKFLVGVFGPTVASWGLLFYYSVDKAFVSRRHKDWLFRLFALLIWALLDTLYGLYFGVNSHILINGLALLLFLTPLLIVKKQFK